MSLKNKIKNFFVDEEYEYEYVEEESDSIQQEKSSNVVSLKSLHQNTSKVVLCEPTSYNEAQEIADHIINRRAVIINLQRMDHHQAKRIIDFLSGTVYALRGDIQKLGMETFLCTPENIDVSGSISGQFENGNDFSFE
ncbi:cell division protein SepF [Compostibacillus humi]|uniref:Cell division protein SepF n=1 Tax=Compostibacillus humi TaxID=1245525 RepID=A0A8J2ZRK5_9BACI|nr:cell division protein SepF [Compostibacillus humi]GGH73473.1 cell division protein SepF [Compostibacillus humi]HLT55138.1 cell division protein SepF [Bacillota bacterium]